MKIGNILASHPPFLPTFGRKVKVSHCDVLTWRMRTALELNYCVALLSTSKHVLEGDIGKPGRRVASGRVARPWAVAAKQLNGKEHITKLNILVANLRHEAGRVWTRLDPAPAASLLILRRPQLPSSRRHVLKGYIVHVAMYYASNADPVAAIACDVAHNYMATGA